MITLGSLGKFENIGVDKKIVEGEQSVTLLNFVDVFNHKHIDSSIPSMTVTASDKKIVSCDVKRGDIFVTPSSETPDDIGHSAVILEDLDNTVYSYHIMRFRLKNPCIITSNYINYLFDTESVKKQIQKKAKGLTRFGLSKDAFASIEVPYPSPKIQEQLVQKLESFTSLISKLEEEIELRKQQFSFYLESLLFGDDDTNILSDYAFMGKGRISADKLSFENYVSVENLLKNKAGRRDAETIPSEGNWHAYSTEDVLIGNIRPYLRKIWFADRDGGTNGDVVVVRSKDKNQLLPRFLYYVLSSEKFFNYYSSSVKDGKMPRGDKGKLLEFAFPYIEKDVQSSLVEKFDTMNTLISKLEEERDLRQKQYEYYREKLLTFE